jgi:hypothetical protein
VRAFAAALAAVAVVLAVAGQSTYSADGERRDASAAQAPLYAVTYGVGGGRLARFDSTLLRGVGRSVRLGQEAPLWAFSPDGRRLAVATPRDGLRLVDLATMRVRGVVLGWRLVYGLAWPSPRRLIVAQHGETAVVDPARGRVLRREIRSGRPWRVARTRDGLVLLTRDGQGIGAARLDSIGRDGRRRSVVLERILVGADGGENNQGPFRGDLPGLAVDEAEQRVWVVGGSGVVAEVRLARLRVSYHEPREARSLLARLAAWLQPAAHAKVTSGPNRTAVWLNGTLAVAGADLRTVRDANGAHDVIWEPFGLRLVDASTNRIRTVDDHATDVAAGPGLLIAYGSWYDGAAEKRYGAGLRAYRPDGSRAFHLFGDAPVETLFVIGREAYVWANARLHAVDLATGEVRARTRPAGMVVLLTR